MKYLTLSTIASMISAASVARAQKDGSAISDGVVRIAVLGDYGSGRDQVAAVVTNIRNSWGNAAPAVDADTVKTLRSHVSSPVERSASQ